MSTNIIYHYTTVSAFLGMMQNCSHENPYLTMWATHASYLNDPMEYVYGKSVCLELLEEIENELQIIPSEQLSTLAKDRGYANFQQMIEPSNATNPEQISEGIPYVIPFSKAKDSLPMWQTYATQGSGLALGFNQEHLIGCQAMIDSCYYRAEDDDHNTVKEEVRKIYTVLTRLIEQIKDPIMIDWYKMNYINQLQSRIGTFIKDRAYEYEQEIRYKAVKSGQVQYRVTNGLLIPYIEQEMPFKALTKIIIGPTADAERTKNALNMMIRSKGLCAPQPSIEISKSPYRG